MTILQICLIAGVVAAGIFSLPGYANRCSKLHLILLFVLIAGSVRAADNAPEALRTFNSFLNTPFILEDPNSRAIPESFFTVSFVATQVNLMETAIWIKTQFNSVREIAKYLSSKPKLVAEPYGSDGQIVISWKPYPRESNGVVMACSKSDKKVVCLIDGTVTVPARP